MSYPQDLPIITASVPLLDPPAWAVLQRHLFATLDASVRPFLDRYVNPDGTLIWGDTLPGRDGADDFYESSYNWPLLYLLGGGDHLLPLSIRQWEAITRQVSEFKPVPQVVNEYERGYDWFHQGESNLYFYFLCQADPTRREHRERAERFAGLYLNDDPNAPNYDATHRIIRAAHNGSLGPRWGFTDDPEPTYNWGPAMRRYGLPFNNVPGISHYDDLEDPALARRMGDAMQERMGRGDVAGNMCATGLVANAAILSGDSRYRDWVIEYTEAWASRAAANNGIIPDNVGLSGQVGEYVGGRWYGGLYGWTWPHGFYSVGMSALVASSSAALLTGDMGHLDLARNQIDRTFELGSVRDYDESAMTIPEHWVGQRVGLKAAGQTQSFLVPHRHDDNGWFDYQPLAAMYPTALWATSMARQDWDRIERLRIVENYDWNLVVPFRSKEDAGHEPPWVRFLAGANPTYPEQILRESLAMVHWRLDRIRNDRADLAKVNIHHWQQHNPVITEALVQLTLGAPSPVYNGGLLHAPIRHFDAKRRRPGLPEDVAALVTSADEDEIAVELINLNPVETREMILQAGGFSEHRFETAHATHSEWSESYPGAPMSSPIAPGVSEAAHRVNGTHVGVRLPPSTRVTIRLRMSRYVNRPTYDLPAMGG